jgi:hypothetical protein
MLSTRQDQPCIMQIGLADPTRMIMTLIIESYRSGKLQYMLYRKLAMLTQKENKNGRKGKQISLIQPPTGN